MSIVDDVLAVAIIGAVYTDALDLGALALALGCLGLLALLGRWGVWRTGAYALVGALLWLATLRSGLHPSIAGMAAGLLIGAHPPQRAAVERAASLFRAFRQSPQASVGASARLGLERAVSVNERLQEALHPLTGFVVVPLFALANAGVDLRGGLLGEALRSPLTWGVVLGLVVGKPVGIGVASLLAVRLGLGSVLQGVGPGQVLAGAALSGIGFTVSLLITDLAFDAPALRDQATVGVLLAALLAVLTGWLTFWLAAVLHGERTASLPLVLDRPVDAARDHIRGPAEAPLTLVEYGDFECPFCGEATGVVRELRERLGDELRYVFRHLPLDGRAPPRGDGGAGGGGRGRPGPLLGDARPAVPAPVRAGAGGPHRLRLYPGPGRGAFHARRWQTRPWRPGFGRTPRAPRPAGPGAPPRSSSARSGTPAPLTRRPSSAP